MLYNSVVIQQLTRYTVGRINKFRSLRQAWLVLVLVTFGVLTLPIFVQATQGHRAWPSLRG